MEKYTDESKKLGRGSFGVVKLVRRNFDNKLLAMKIIDITAEETSKNAYNEHSLLESLQHPNIVKFYETFVDKDHLCLVMEYCEEGDLQKKVKEAKQQGEYLSEELILEYFAQVCLAVKRLHDNRVIHRDIKVHNVFLTSSGLVKLGDFGISKQLEHTRDLGQTWLGTPFYVSPEMISRCHSSYKSDIWMLGCLLHELCSLEKPFNGEYYNVTQKILYDEYSEVPDHYSTFIHDLIEKLLSKDPDDRPLINEVLAYPEIAETIRKIKLKYPTVYQHKHLKPVFMKRSRSDIHESFESWNAQDLYSFEKSYDEEQKELNLVCPKVNNSAQLTDSFVPIKRKSNNIRSLVEQKKATLSPSNTEKPSPNQGPNTFRTFTSICSVIKSPNSPFCAHNQIIQPIKINTTRLNESDLLYDDKRYSKTVETQEADDDDSSQENISYEIPNNTYSQKGAEGIRRLYNNLSINIPGGSEQNENRHIVKKEKLKPAKLKSPLNETGDTNNVPTTKVGTQKTFSFTNYLFDHKSPVSPNRTFWVSQFLKQKLGDEKYEKVLKMLESSGNPTHLLKEQPEKVIEIIGEEKRDCLLMLSFLILHNSNSITPTGETKGQAEKSYNRATELYRGSRSLKSPASSNPFLKNIFPCVTDPDSLETHSQSSIDDIKPTRKIVSDAPKLKEHYDSLSESPHCVSDNVRDIN